MTTRRLALVTGASRGIGRGIAMGLASDGFDVVISSRNVSALEDIADDLREAGAHVLVAPCDMAREGEIEALVETVHQVGRPLHVAVLAAGVGVAGEFGSYPLRRLDTQWAVNVRGAFQLVQGLLPLLRAGAVDVPQLGARVVAIASITGVVSAPGLAAYGATKAALIALCESISAAEGSKGVSATAISPGYVDTDMTAWVRDELDPSDMIQVADVAELAVAVCRLSRHATVPNIVVSRPGGQLWRP